MDHDTVERRVLDLLDGQRSDAPRAPVRLEERAEVDVGEAVAAHDEEGGVVEELAERVGAARGAHELLLEVVPQLHAELGPVAEVGADLVRMVVQVGGDLRHAVLAQQMEQVLHHGTVEDRHHGLGRETRERVEPSAEAGGHEVRAHGAIGAER